MWIEFWDPEWNLHRIVRKNKLILVFQAAFIMMLAREAIRMGTIHFWPKRCGRTNTRLAAGVSGGGRCTSSCLICLFCRLSVLPSIRLSDHLSVHLSIHPLPVFPPKRPINPTISAMVLRKNCQLAICFLSFHLKVNNADRIGSKENPTSYLTEQIIEQNTHQYNSQNST